MFLGPQYGGIAGSSISSKIGIDGIENFTWLTFQLLVGQKPSNNIRLCWRIDFDKQFKIPSQYSIYGFMTLAHISSFKILDKVFYFTLMWYVNVVRMTSLLLKGDDPIDLWYSRSEGDHICVGRGRCKRVDLITLHSSNGLNNCIVVVPEFIFQQF